MGSYLRRAGSGDRRIYGGNWLKPHIHRTSLYGYLAICCDDSGTPLGPHRGPEVSMILHIVAYLLCVPMIVGLGIFNTKRRIFTTGEIRFWGATIMVGTELIFLGAFN